jgi:hypothetical protein
MNLTKSASIYLPFFDGEWWSVMIKKTGTAIHQLILNYILEIKCMKGVKMEPLLVFLVHPQL